MGKKKPETLCKRKEYSYLDDPRAYREAIGKANLVCEKCGRVAGDKKLLCHPTKLE